MDEKYPGDADPRPKRRKDPDNPYEIFTVGIGTDSPRYYLRFRDGSFAGHCLEIDRALFEALNRFELEDLSHLNEVDNHYETRDLPEEVLTVRIVNQPEMPEETTLRHLEMERLYKAMKRLPLRSIVGWCCTILRILLMTRSRKWRDAGVKQFRSQFALL